MEYVADTGGSPHHPNQLNSATLAPSPPSPSSSSSKSLSLQKPALPALTADDELCSRCAGLVKAGLLNLSTHKPECVVRQHRDQRSCWIVAKNDVYDATNFLGAHPGGPLSILNRSESSADCAMDLSYHSAAAKKLWKRHRIGRLAKCGVPPKGQACTIM